MIRPYKTFLIFTITSVLFCNSLQRVDEEKVPEAKELINYFEHLRKEISKSTSEKEKQKLMNRARKFIFDMLTTEEIARFSLGRALNHISELQYSEFKLVFHNLMSFHITQSYLPSDIFVEISDPVEVLAYGNRRDPIFNVDALILKLKIKSNKAVYIIDFYLMKSDKNYKIYDIHIDGASVLADYRRQFQFIIRAKGFEYLLEKLNEKLSAYEEEKTSK